VLADDALVILLAALAARPVLDPVVENIVPGLVRRGGVANPPLDLLDLNLASA
jgi:hypothetical protein